MYHDPSLSAMIWRKNGGAVIIRFDTDTASLTSRDIWTCGEDSVWEYHTLYSQVRIKQNDHSINWRDYDHMNETQLPSS